MGKGPVRGGLRDRPRSPAALGSAFFPVRLGGFLWECPLYRRKERYNSREPTFFTACHIKKKTQLRESTDLRTMRRATTR